MDYQCLRYERTGYAKQIRKQYEAGKLNERRCNMREWSIRKDGICNTISTVLKDTILVEIDDDVGRSSE